MRPVKNEKIYVRFGSKPGGFQGRVEQTTACKYCQKDITWIMVIHTGRKMPIDPDPDEQGLYISHHFTCENYERPSRKKPVEE